MEMLQYPGTGNLKIISKPDGRLRYFQYVHKPVIVSDL